MGSETITGGLRHPLLDEADKALTTQQYNELAQKIFDKRREYRRTKGRFPTHLIVNRNDYHLMLVHFVEAYCIGGNTVRSRDGDLEYMGMLVVHTINQKEPAVGAIE